MKEIEQAYNKLREQADLVDLEIFLKVAREFGINAVMNYFEELGLTIREERADANK